MSSKEPLSIAGLQKALELLKTVMPHRSIVAVYVSNEVWELMEGKRVLDIMLTWPSPLLVTVIKNPFLKAGSYMLEYSDGSFEFVDRGTI